MSGRSNSSIRENECTTSYAYSAKAFAATTTQAVHQQTVTSSILPANVSPIEKNPKPDTLTTYPYEVVRIRVLDNCFHLISLEIDTLECTNSTIDKPRE